MVRRPVYPNQPQVRAHAWWGRDDNRKEQTVIGIHFDKEYAGQVLDAIRTGRPIPLPPGGWTQNAELTLAGIMAAAAKSHGPQTGPFHGRNYGEFLKQPAERQEAVQDTFHRDLHAGIDVLSQLTLDLVDGTYDARFEGEVEAGVRGRPDG